MSKSTNSEVHSCSCLTLASLMSFVTLSKLPNLLEADFLTRKKKSRLLSLKKKKNKYICICIYAGT